MCRMGTVGVVCIRGDWMCSVGAPVYNVCTQMYLYFGALFIYTLKPVGVMWEHNGPVCPGCGALSVVWVLRSMYTWV